jgi:[acyl-carrier-protein] S-malonyltransferase
MNRKTAFLFPGQGAQYPGMGRDFYSQFPIARQTFEEADDLLSTRFSSLIFEGPAAELTLTRNSQLAIYITSIAIWRTVIQQFPHLKAELCAGLSLGEYTALTAASTISFSDCLFLVQARAQYMDEACSATPGTMNVVLGLSEAQVAEAIRGLPEVWVANLNCPGQVVIAGTKRGIEGAIAPIKTAGAKRVLPLDVSGAFHTPLMSYAQERLEPKIRAVPLQKGEAGVVMNVTGSLVSSIEEARQRLIEQVVQPVRWEESVRCMMERKIEFFLEMGCGKTLGAMNKRIGVSSPTLSIDKIEDLDELAKLVEGYASFER